METFQSGVLKYFDVEAAYLAHKVRAKNNSHVPLFSCGALSAKIYVFIGAKNTRTEMTLISFIISPIIHKNCQRTIDGSQCGNKDSTKSSPNKLLAKTALNFLTRFQT